MPPKKKVKKQKTKPKSTNTNINRQTVIINQPVKRKYTRRKSTTQQPKSQFSTPESSFGQVFNLLRFIPQYQQPNYQSIQNPPQPIQMIESKKPENPFLLGNILEEPDEIEGSVRDLDERFDDLPELDKYSTLIPDKRIDEEEKSAEEGSGGGGGGGGEVIITKTGKKFRISKTSDLSVKQLNARLATARRSALKYEEADEEFKNDPTKINSYEQAKRNIKRLEDELAKRG